MGLGEPTTGNSAIWDQARDRLVIVTYSILVGTSRHMRRRVATPLGRHGGGGPLGDGYLCRLVISPTRCPVKTCADGAYHIALARAEG